jgi:hypothetical protein
MILPGSRRPIISVLGIVALIFVMGCTTWRPKVTPKAIAASDGYHSTKFQAAMRLAGPQEIQAFFAAWGTVSSNYDTVVLDEIYFRTSDRVRSGSDELAIICDRLASLPGLKQQVAWHFCNTHYPVTHRPDNEKECLKVLHDNLFGKERNEWAKVYYLTAIETLVGLDAIVDRQNASELDTRWAHLQKWLNENIYQLRFNEDSHSFERCLPGEGNCPSIRYWPFPEAQYESRI